MAKIKHYKVPVTVTRDKTGNIHLDIKESEKKFDKDELVSITDGSEVMKLAKGIADDNSREHTIVKSTLLDSEEKNDTFITMKYLEE